MQNEIDWSRLQQLIRIRDAGRNLNESVFAERDWDDLPDVLKQIALQAPLEDLALLRDHL
jgi:hypothetical protein